MATTQIKDGFNGGSDNGLKVNADGSINVNGGGGGTTDVNIHDSSGNPLNSVAGALEVTGNITGTVTSELAGLTSFQTSQYSIGVAPVQLTPVPLANRSSISIRVTVANGEQLYIGPNNTVTTLTGYPLYDGDTFQMDLTPSNTIYAVATAAGQTLYVLEIA